MHERIRDVIRNEDGLPVAEIQGFDEDGFAVIVDYLPPLSRSTWQESARAHSARPLRRGFSPLPDIDDEAPF